MTDRLSPQDVSFLYQETATAAMHVGGVLRFDTADGEPVGHDELCALVTRRIARIPRFRQRVAWVPGHLANPVWVDDDRFDITYHVRRSALPRPGSDDQLREFVGRVQSRRLDRTRPLWEMYLVEGLADGRFAIVTKTHHAMIEGADAVDVAALILDEDPAGSPTVDSATQRPWQPRRAPGRVELVGGAVLDNALRPLQVLDTARAEVADVRMLAGRAVGALGSVASTLGASWRGARSSPLTVSNGEQRRFAMAATTLDAHRLVRKSHGGTVNDVVLATVAGALRIWLLTRGEAVAPTTTVRAMVPVTVGEDAGRSVLTNRVTAVLVDLPVGEPSPVLRLHQVGYAMKAHNESRHSVDAGTLIALAGFAPPTLHGLAARVGAGLTSRLSEVMVANVPGPQYPLYAAGSRLVDCYPVLPLAKDQALTVGITSYDGGVYYGLNGDRDAMADLDVLAGCLVEALDELVGTA